MDVARRQRVPAVQPALPLGAGARSARRATVSRALRCEVPECLAAKGRSLSLPNRGGPPPLDTGASPLIGRATRKPPRRRKVERQATH